MASEKVKNLTTELKKVRVDGKSIAIGEFGAKEGWRIAHKLSSTAGPAVAELFNDDYGKAVSTLFEKMSADEMLEMIDTLTSVVLVDDAKWSDRFLKDRIFTLQVCAEVVKYNFDDFFSPLQEMFDDLLKEKAAKA